VPLAERSSFARQRDAFAWLWKDHTAHAEAQEITELARIERPEYLARCGGTYSSEWLWSKALHCLRVSPKVFKAAATWLELCDYIPALLTDCKSADRIRRGVCAAGHKAMFDPADGLPSAEFLGKLHPQLGALRGRMYAEAHTSDTPAGGLSPAWGRRLGLPAGIPVAVGAIDAHVGAVGSGIRPGRLVKILGTSSCDMLVAPGSADVPEIPGLCGVVNGSILPGHWGFEAGQPAVGDLLNWWASEFDARKDAHAKLTAAAGKLRPGESGLVALDWNNGNRSVLVDVRLTGLLVGQTLQTRPAEVYRALIEATAFGARKIVDRMEACGVAVREVVACGGIAEKNALFMQIYADVLGRPMKVSRSSQTCALGAAIFGAVVGGAHRSVEQAQEAMCGLRPGGYRPAAAARKAYDRLYNVYGRLHDAFGDPKRGAAVDGVMKELLAIRDQARARS
jgi:L-ribulokinase